jgi:UDP-glucose 4-epimerase
MKSLVIGGWGFIGRHFVDLLCKSGREVTILGRSAEIDGPLPANCRYVSGDYGNRALLKELLIGCDEVVDLAYSTVPKTSYQDPVFDLLSNLPASVGLLQEAAVGSPRRLLFVSSGGTIYGHSGYLPIDEAHPTNPISPYGITKLTIEKYARLFAMAGELEVVIARPANAYGENQRTGTGQGFIAAAVQAALSGSPLQVFGGGDTIRDYIHVEDLAAGLLAALDFGTNGECYNIGTGVGTSNRNVIEKINCLAAPAGIKGLRVQENADRPFDVKANVLDSSKLISVSRWNPLISVDEGIKHVWHYAAHSRLSP